MSVGSLATLMTMLQAAPTLADASVVFGEENIAAQDYPLPMVVVEPTSGAFRSDGEPGYYQNADVNLNNIWMKGQTIDLWLWAASLDPNAYPVDHADAIECFEAQVLQALQFQAPNGLKFHPVADRWQTDGKAVVRYGRALVLTVVVDITIPDVLPVYATVETVTQTASI